MTSKTFMIQSMTGFGSAKAENESARVEVQIKSVNGRFLELRIKGPREYGAFESEIRSRIQKHLGRGSVDVWIDRRLKPLSHSMNVMVRSQLANDYWEQVKKLCHQLKLDLPSSDALLKQSDLIVIEPLADASGSEKELLFKALDEALAHHLADRQREGEALAQELLGLLGQLGTQQEKLAQRFQRLQSESPQRHQEKLERLLASYSSKELDPQRLAQEVAIQFDRQDVTEELARLKTHIKAVEQLILQHKVKDPIGKRIDFLIQELHREMNTLGVKSQDLEMVSLSVEGKSLVEKIREQVQNVQ